jgi:carbamoyl-phosphate synthase large subunit
MPKRKDLNKVLVIGSGPIIIGQAAEFDYSGTQACKALREEGLEVVLVNSNPATIMTDKDMADKVYIEPITLDMMIRILKRERPGGILSTMGGQTGLNMAVQLKENGILDELGIELLGISLDSIRNAEDREKFKQTMEAIGEKVPGSTIVRSREEASAFAETAGFPLIIRPAYTLGGTGGGIAHNPDELNTLISRGLKHSMINQVLLEQSLAGWKEIEYELIQDNAGNFVVVCNMENLDPVGIHTGDSIVTAPCQTLSKEEDQMLRDSSRRIIRALKIRGGCNIQFALHPTSGEYFVIEVNPRVSRSSALASKATGYPIARVASKIAIGLNLDEIECRSGGGFPASSEPVMDYIVTKVPRWPFDKFVTADRTLSTQMKATGEVMAIGRTFEESLLKAIDSLDVRLDYHLGMAKIASWTDEEIRASLKNPDDERIFVVSEALNRGYRVEEIQEITNIDPYFIEKLKNINDLSKALQSHTEDSLSRKILFDCKLYGFGDSYIASLIGSRADEVRSLRLKWGIKPSYRLLDACTGELETAAPCLYSTYAESEETTPSGRKKVIVLGSGPIRIGQGIEFDYCSVHSVKTLREMGIEAIIINNNPETVSTDSDISDVLYFEPLTLECVLDIIDREQPLGVIVQFGGQTSLNLAEALHKIGVRILGTSFENIDKAEDRDRFIKLLDSLNITYPPGGIAHSLKDALRIAHSAGYPVVVRPSYVLGGRAMEIVYNDEELKTYIKAAVQVSQNHPVLVDKYISGKEVEVDLICDGQNVLIPGIMEHIERAGIHSGDSISVYPPQSLSPAVRQLIADASAAIARSLQIKGLMNIQFVVDSQDRLYVLEANPRASRTVPILSKVTNVPMVSLAVKIALGHTLAELDCESGLLQESALVTVKAPVFSFSKITTVDPFLGPEMKSTGEVMGTDTDFLKALTKALLASGMTIPAQGAVLFSIANRDKKEASEIAEKLIGLGFSLYATEHTCQYLTDKGLTAAGVSLEEALSLIRNDKVVLVINTPTQGKSLNRPGFILRRAAMEFNVPSVTALDTARALLQVIEANIRNLSLDPIPLNEYARGTLFDKTKERMTGYAV